jgi:hypothetical protein
LNPFFLTIGILRIGIPLKIVFAILSDRFQPAPYSKVHGSRLNPRVQIFPPDYLGTYALYKDDVFGNFVCLIMFQDKNWVVAPPVIPQNNSRA